MPPGSEVKASSTRSPAFIMKGTFSLRNPRVSNPSSVPASFPAPAHPLRIGLIGFGTVGSSVARILIEDAPAGLQLAAVANRNVARKRTDWVPSSVLWTDHAEDMFAREAGIDVFVELVGGLEPASGWVRSALTAGRSVVTANKKLIAFHGPELESLARHNGCHLLFGAAVAGGIPVIPGIEHGLSGDRITRVEGILNGTCNFILSAMESGADYATVLADAQHRGYAEADPTEDVAGYDARAKLAILMRLAMRVHVHPEQIEARPITTVSAVDFAYAAELDSTIRQIARAEQTSAGLAAVVSPMLIPRQSPLAWSTGTENMVVTCGTHGGEVVFSGHGAGGHPTAVAVVSDLVNLAHGLGRIPGESFPAQVTIEPAVPHYIRFLVRDRPGIVASIAGALAAESININAILQKPGCCADRLPFVVTVEPCRTSALRRALEAIEQMDFVLEKPLDMQILKK